MNRCRRCGVTDDTDAFAPPVTWVTPTCCDRCNDLYVRVDCLIEGDLQNLMLREAVQILRIVEHTDKLHDALEAFAHMNWLFDRDDKEMRKALRDARQLVGGP